MQSRQSQQMTKLKNRPFNTHTLENLWSAKRNIFYFDTKTAESAEDPTRKKFFSRGFALFAVSCIRSFGFNDFSHSPLGF